MIGHPMRVRRDRSGDGAGRKGKPIHRPVPGHAITRKVHRRVSLFFVGGILPRNGKQGVSGDAVLSRKRTE
jgi:hypothetical protein